MSLHGLGIRFFFKEYASKDPVCTWASNNGSWQAPLYFLVKPSWILDVEDWVTVNKLAVVDQAIRGEGPEASKWRWIRSLIYRGYGHLWMSMLGNIKMVTF